MMHVCPTCGTALSNDGFFDDGSHEIVWDGKRQHVSPTQLLILKILRRYPGQFVSFDRIYSSVYSGVREGRSDATIRVQIHQLRQRLQDTPLRICGRYGLGYRLEVRP